MLDRKYIVENADAVKQNCVNRGVTADVDRLVELETQRRAKLQESQELNRQANEKSKLIGKAKDNEEREQLKEAARQLREKKDLAQREHDELEKQILQRLITLQFVDVLDVLSIEMLFMAATLMKMLQ